MRPSRGAGRLTSYLEAMARGVPPSFARGVSRELVLAVEELADAPGRRRVVADGPIAAALSARLARRSPVIYNAHNLESAFRREARAGGDPLSTRMLPRFERGRAAPLLRGLDGQPQGHGRLARAGPGRAGAPRARTSSTSPR